MENKTPKFPWIIDFDDQYNEVEPVFDFEYNECHEAVVVYQGDKNIQAEIDSHLDECDMSIIMERLLAGDPALDPNQGIYGDITEMPTNQIEARQYIESQKEKLAATVTDSNSIFFGMTGEQIAALSNDDIKTLIANKSTAAAKETTDE